MTVAEMERVCEKRLEKCSEESKQNLARIQEEHIALVCVKYIIHLESV